MLILNNYSGHATPREQYGAGSLEGTSLGKMYHSSWALVSTVLFFLFFGCDAK